jgi:hypothetical protein
MFIFHFLNFQVWLGSFIRRWKEEIAARKTSKKTLGEMSLTVDRLKNFHENLRESLKDVPASNILNMDETAMHWDK